MKPLMQQLLSASVLITLSISGCRSDAPPERPPVDALDPYNGGLQGKDVQSATEKFASGLLALPALNTSDRKWTIVIVDPTNQTASPYGMQYNVFSERLKTVLLQKSQGRVELIAKKADYHNLQNQELDVPAGGGVPVGVQPDYALSLTINELPNRSTDYYQVNGTLTSLNGRQIFWNDTYEIQAAR